MTGKSESRINQSNTEHKEGKAYEETRENEKGFSKDPPISFSPKNRRFDE